MLKKGFVLLIVLGLLFSAAAVFAIDPEESTIQSVEIEDFGYMMRFTDGRLNQWDLVAPVAVYYNRAMVPKLDADGVLILLADGRKEYVDQVVSLDLWGLHPETGFVDHLLHMPIDEVHAMIEAATEPMELATAFGYQIGYSPEGGGWYWVTAPPDGSGNSYVFKWQE